MSRILAYTSPARGHLYPLTSILLELRSRGHDVAVRTLASEVDLLRGLGFTAEPIDPRIEARALDDWSHSHPQAALKASVATFADRAIFDSSDLADAIDDHRPEAVIVDTNAWGAQAAAESWGGPWCSLMPFPTPLPSADVPPFGLGLPPARGALGRMRDAALRPMIIGAIERATLPRFDEVRAGMGLDPLRTAAALYANPPLTLLLTAEPFEYHRKDWPASFVQVGPCDWDPPGEPPAWLDEIDQPIALVTTSSEYQADGRLVDAAVDGLHDLGLYVVATLPAEADGPLVQRDRARIERFVPHRLVLDRAVVAVTHGGMGATQKALARGVPVCAVPFGRDQFEVARRVEVSGAGSRLPGKKLTVGRLREATRTAMTRTAGARRVAAGFAAAGGPSSAAGAIETRLLGQPAKTAR